MSTKTWLSAYLYYNEPWENLLQEALIPFVEQSLKANEVEQYFFIRYWEKGPHIRLRFYGNATYLQNELKPRLMAYFSAYFSEKPSVRENQELIDKLPDEHKWFENNSIQFIDYEPETERYGGEEALLVAERQFQVSSDVVLAAISESSNWNYERALGVAIQMHLAFGFALGMNAVEMAEFYSYIFKGWLPMAYNAYDETLTKEQHLEKQNEVVVLFAQQFNSQKNVLVPYHEAILEALSDGDEFEEEWLNKWISSMQQIYVDLLALAKEDRITYPDRYLLNGQYKTDADRVKLWGIYASYVHMTNNRLGIQNRDEGFLGYLIMKSLENIA